MDELQIHFKALENVTTGENLLKVDSVKVTEFSKDTLELELQKSHSLSVGNLIILDLVVAYLNQTYALKIMGKVIENHQNPQEPQGDKDSVPKDNARFVLKLVQYNADVWLQILKAFEVRQEAVTSLFKNLRGR